MKLDQELLQIERTLWTNDAEIYGRTFLPDAVIIFPEIGRIDPDFALNALHEESAAGQRWAEVDLQDIRVFTVAPDVTLLHYEATARWNYKKNAEKVLCATLYVKQDGAWRVAFHQQTAA
jgi:uncharacterized protein (TIGR02246 family)